MDPWPRLRDLPAEERQSFNAWLGDQLRPRLENVSSEEQDAFFPWDYIAWRSVPEGHRLTAWIKIPFDTSAVDEAMKSIGGICLDQTHINRPAGIRLADYQLERHAIELKTLENEPLDVLTRQRRLGEFVQKHRLRGTCRLTREQNDEYWIKILGVPVQRVIDDAAKQIDSTRKFLRDPELLGAILIVNEGADTLNATSLINLAKHYAHRNSCIDLVMVLSLIPTMFEGHAKPALNFNWDAFSPKSTPVAEKVERAIYEELCRRAGKKLETFEPADTIKSRPIRGPYNINTDRGTISIR